MYTFLFITKKRVERVQASLPTGRLCEWLGLVWVERVGYIFARSWSGRRANQPTRQLIHKPERVPRKAFTRWRMSWRKLIWWGLKKFMSFGWFKTLEIYVNDGVQNDILFNEALKSVWFSSQGLKSHRILFEVKMSSKSALTTSGAHYARIDKWHFKRWSKERALVEMSFRQKFKKQPTSH